MVFLWLILSGNKSPEALKVSFNSVDEYGHEVSNSENVGGYKLSVPKGSDVTYVREAGSVSNPLTPNATLNGSDHYLFNSNTIGSNANPPTAEGDLLQINFEITLPNGLKLNESDLGIDFRYD